MPDEEPDFCSLCPASGAPRPPKPNQETEPNKSTAPPSDERPDLQWIACHKCDNWFHSVCVISGEFKSSLPDELLAEVDASGEGVWYDWASRVDRWFCKPCIESSATDNPRRRPLATTLKKLKKKGRRSSASEPPKSTPKRARLNSKDATPPPPPPDMNVTNGADPPPAQSRPKRQAALDRPDYYSMHNHVATPTKQWVDLIKDPAKYGRVIAADNFPRVPGHILRKEWVEGRGSSEAGDAFPPEFPPTLFYGPTREPLVVHPSNGGLASMGGVIPDPSLTVDDVARLVGPEKMVDVIDVATQTSSQWPLQKWADYVRARADPTAASSSKVYNIISLEISGTELAQRVRPPRIVSDVDWVENFWPFPGGKEATMRAAAKSEAEGAGAVEDGAAAPKGRAKNEWPKVQLYCLMGMKDSWTDWHIDFAASSVYYSVHTGSKVFFFIRPTEANLAAYAQWSGSAELQASTWLGDMVDEVRKVTLKAGDTMIIPAGYIHAVFTPVDSIVFGGNFVHSYDIPTQLRLRQIEIDTKVPQRFRFPYFDKLCWHVANKYAATLRALREYRPHARTHKEQPTVPDRVLRGLVALARFLITQVDALESQATDDKTRKLIWNRIPGEVSDAAGLAHELLWRAERELPEGWDEEEEVAIDTSKKRRKQPAKATGAGAKKQQKSMKLLDRPPESRTWRFSPAPWEQDEHPIAKETSSVKRVRPGGEQEEEAEMTTATYRQSRRRVKEENGGMVLEEQELVFTERRVVWPAPEEKPDVE